MAHPSSHLSISFASFCNIAQTARPRENAPPTEADKQVFILGEGPDCTSSQVIVTNILGTSFAVSSRHVLTAHHNLCDVDAITPMYDVNGVALVGKYLIARSGTKVGSEIALVSPREVKLVKFDLTNDWAVLELVDSSEHFPFWLSLCEKSELPSLDTEIVDVKTLS